MEDIIIFLGIAFNLNLPLLTAWLLDHWLGDPVWLPHPVVAFGKTISFCEHRLNKGNARFLKGAVMSLVLVAGVYLLTLFLLRWAAHYSPGLLLTLQVLLIFYCLAGTTLVREVCGVFKAVDRSLEEGRKQVARIVGRDTSGLSAQEVRTAALETLAENLSDGVIAPLFWYMLLGVPGMLAYKMINTLDSMIGYRNERYRRFGCFAARLDDVANYIPARLTAFLMVAVSGRFPLLLFVGKYGSKHASPNSGYPEAALAGILDCRFGGPHNYFGEEVWKPYIGDNERPLTTEDMRIAVRINRSVEWIMVIIVVATATCMYVIPSFFCVLKGNPDDTAIGCQCAECLFGFDDAGIYLCANQDAAVGKNGHPLVGLSFQLIEKVADTPVLHGERLSARSRYIQIVGIPLL